MSARLAGDPYPAPTQPSRLRLPCGLNTVAHKRLQCPRVALLTQVHWCRILYSELRTFVPFVEGSRSAVAAGCSLDFAGAGRRLHDCLE